MVSASMIPPAAAEQARNKRSSLSPTWRPLWILRREIDCLFDEYGQDFWTTPFRQSVSGLQPSGHHPTTWIIRPVVDIIETDLAYEIAAELPGMNDKDIEVEVANGELTVKGEKQEDKEETKKNYHVLERRTGSFERRFRLPQGVDTEKIEAVFKEGVLRLTLPRTPEARKAERKIVVTAHS